LYNFFVIFLLDLINLLELSIANHTHLRFTF
jgi:hypothetical protein